MKDKPAATIASVRNMYPSIIAGNTDVPADGCCPAVIDIVNRNSIVFFGNSSAASFRQPERMQQIFFSRDRKLPRVSSVIVNNEIDQRTGSPLVTGSWADA